MSEQKLSEPKQIKTLKDTNYFRPGTYKRDWRDYMAEVGIANIITRFVLAPVERWRIIKQTQVAFPLRPLHFSSVFDYIARVPKQQGVTALWRGNMAGIWLYFTQTLLQFGFYDNLKALQKDLVAQQQPGSFFRVLSERMFFPMISTFFTQCITFPIDTARVRITMNYAKEKKNFPFLGIRTCLKAIRQQENFAAMYRGFLLSNAISLINFNLYLAFASVMNNVDFGSDVKDFINADTISAVGALLLVHPLDSLKKIIQLNNISSPPIFKSGRMAVAYIKREASLGVLYNGIMVSTVKSLLFLPTYFLVQKGLDEGKKQVKF